MNNDLQQLKYPIGKHQKPSPITPEHIKQFIQTIADFPIRIKQATEHLSDLQLDTPYRPEGWTIRQLVNHCADSHSQALFRFKLALTEHKPVIKTYQQDAWAALPDSSQIPIQPALSIIDGIHARWVALLRTLAEHDWDKTFIHPEHGKELALSDTLSLYAWHCRHHLAHIAQAPAQSARPA